MKERTDRRAHRAARYQSQCLRRSLLMLSLSVAACRIASAELTIPFTYSLSPNSPPGNPPPITTCFDRQDSAQLLSFNRADSFWYSQPGTGSIKYAALKGDGAEPQRAADDDKDRTDGDRDDDQDADDDGVKKHIQELFLGFIVYPQQKGEVQTTIGYFRGENGPDDTLMPLELEYGITDRLQIGLEVPFENFRDGGVSERGVKAIETDTYYNFYSDRASGRSYGIGFNLSTPTASSALEPRAMHYEPFFVAYRDFGRLALNFSAGVDIEDPLDCGIASKTSGEFALAAIRPVGKWVWVLETSVEVEHRETPVRLAPALYWHPTGKDNIELAASLPIGLNRDTTSLGAFAMFIFEFGGKENSRK